MKTAAALASLAAACLLAAGGGAKTAGSGCGSGPAFHPGSLGAVAFWNSGSLHVVALASGNDRKLYTPPRSAGVGAHLSWSKNGRFVIAGDRLVPAAGGRPCTAVSPGVGSGSQDLSPSGALRLVTSRLGRSLWVVDVATGRRRRLYRSPSERIGPPVNPRWSLDGRWVLFQTDPFSGASAAADGLPLLAVRSSGGRVVEIERSVLATSDFVQSCGGRSLVISAGPDRYVSAHKRVDIASPPSWRPRHVSHDAGRSWFSAACTSDAELVAATATVNREEGAFDSADRSIWLLAADGSSRRLLVGAPGDKLSDEAPRWSKDGRFILYVEHSTRPRSRARVYLVEVRTGKRRGPLAEVGTGLGYYGRRDWSAIIPWYQP